MEPHEDLKALDSGQDGAGPFVGRLMRQTGAGAVTPPAGDWALRPGGLLDRPDLFHAPCSDEEVEQMFRANGTPPKPAVRSAPL